MDSFNAGYISGSDFNFPKPLKVPSWSGLTPRQDGGVSVVTQRAHTLGLAGLEAGTGLG